MSRKRIILSVGVFLLILAFTVGNGICVSPPKETKDDLYSQLELLTDAITLVRSDYVTEVKSKDLIYGALKGMLSSLDPYSQFMDPDTYNEIKVETEGSFGGLGIEISIKDGLLTIISPIEDTPAFKAGLKPGDRIVKINKESTKDITLIDAVKRMRGKPGTPVTLTILREKEKQLSDYTVVRDIIKIKSIKEAKLIEDKIGYIKLIEFQENSSKDLEDALDNLQKGGMDSLILDLRNNPGGLLNVAVEVSDKFLPADKMIVSTKGRLKNQNLEFKSTSRQKHLDFPMVILVNNGSASASEIVAGAMQDHKRGILLGVKTFGKGSVQTVIPLKDGSALRLTTSKYFTPSGRSIHDLGIAPDVVVELEESKEEKAEQPAAIFEKIKTQEQKFEPKHEKESKDKEKISAETEGKPQPYDNQLARAVDLIKGIKVYISMGNGQK